MTQLNPRDVRMMKTSEIMVLLLKFSDSHRSRHVIDRELQPGAGGLARGHPAGEGQCWERGGGFRAADSAPRSGSRSRPIQNLSKTEPRSNAIHTGSASDGKSGTMTIIFFTLI